MTRVDTVGAPRAQGVAQGLALRSDIRASVVRARRARGRLAWWSALVAARRGPGLAVARFLPQQHERLEGIARAAGVSVAALEWLDAEDRVALRVATEGVMVGAVAPPGIALVLRRSEPDAGGFASVELTGPAWAGCLGGVNGAGLAVVVALDAPRGEPSIRLLAQDLLLRAPRVDAAQEQVRRRAPYLRQSGALLVADPDAAPRRLELRAGALLALDARDGSSLGEGAVLRVDPARRSLRFGARGAPEIELRA